MRLLVTYATYKETLVVKARLTGFTIAAQAIQFKLNWSTIYEKRLVNGVFQSLASFEAWNLGSSNADRLASLWVTASACSTIFHRESTKAYQHNRLTSLQSASYGFDNCVQSTASGSFRDIGRSSNCINQFRLIHSESP